MSMEHELIFLVEDPPEGGYIARALGASIFTEGDDLESLRGQVRDAVHCHYDEVERPPLFKLRLCSKKLPKHNRKIMFSA